MRREATPPERALWACLKSDQLLGAKFRRQVVIGPYIADFACRSPVKLVVELDGESHGAQTEYDARRTRYLERLGYRVLRFSNPDVLRNREDVLATIALNLTAEPLSNSA